MRGVANIKDVVGAVMGKVAPDRLKKDILKAVWKRAVGDEADRHCRPVAIRKKVLVVAVDSSVWIYHLSLQKHEILKKIKKPLTISEVENVVRLIRKYGDGFVRLRLVSFIKRTLKGQPTFIIEEGYINLERSLVIGRIRLNSILKLVEDAIIVSGADFEKTSELVKVSI